MCVQRMYVVSDSVCISTLCTHTTVVHMLIIENQCLQVSALHFTELKGCQEPGSLFCYDCTYLYVDLFCQKLFRLKF